MLAKTGDTVVVNYTGTLEDGTIFDSSYHEDHTHPIEFEIGSGNIIKGFDEAVIGMKIGEEKDIIIKPEDAYGMKSNELIQEIPKENFGELEDIEIGMPIELSTPDGQTFPSTIVSINENSITVDLNHPLAGETLHFKIKLEEIK